MKHLLHLPHDRAGKVLEEDPYAFDLPQMKEARHSDMPAESNGMPSAFQSLSISGSRPLSDSPVCADFDCSHLTIGAGVAIFHLATSRVVVCRHSIEKRWFLPKGRRDPSEETGIAAEREGFEEVRPSDIIPTYESNFLKTGYRNRLLPVPIRHRQPRAHNVAREDSHQFVTEPIWTQLIPQTRTSQYILFWYIAESVPPYVEDDLNAKTAEFATDETPTPYQVPPKYIPKMSLTERIKLDLDGYVPTHHANTGVDSEEALFESHLLPVNEAVEKLKGTVMEDVVKSGWEAICLRNCMECEARTAVESH